MKKPSLPAVVAKPSSEIVVAGEQPKLLAHLPGDLIVQTKPEPVSEPAYTRLTDVIELRAQSAPQDDGDVEEEIFRRIVSTAASDHSPVELVYGAAAAWARGEGRADDARRAAELRYFISEMLTEKKQDEEQGLQAVDFYADDFPGMGELIMKRAPNLMFGTSGRWFNGYIELSRSAVEGSINNLLVMCRFYRPPPWHGTVTLSTSICREVMTYISGKRMFDDRRAANTPAPRILDVTPVVVEPTRVGPRFEDVLVLDPDRWTSQDDINKAVDAVWRAWCAQTGTRPDDRIKLGVQLNAWAGGGTIKRVQRRQAGRKPWGYLGLGVR
jgi:hypothetical protein